MSNKYNSENVFAKIIKGEMNANKVYEDDKMLAFHDLYPQAPVHVLVIPKGEFINFADFVSNASHEFCAHFFSKVSEIAASLGVNEGYRMLSNTGASSGQTVFHFHVHIMGGFKH